MSHFWQHDEPLPCPHGHEMIWLGGPYWICSKCRGGKGEIFVQTAPRKTSTAAKEQQCPTTI